MAHDLKLGLYKVGIRNYKKRIFLSFKEVFDKISTKPEKHHKYEDFAKAYLQSFNGEFKSSDDSKSLALSKWGIKKEKDIIFGTVIGGLTDIEREIYIKNNSSKAKGMLGKDEIAALPYFFMLWIPPDSSIGILLFQYYSSSSLFGAFNDNLKEFFKKNFNLTFHTFPFVPEEYQTTFLKESIIKKIAILKKKVEKSARKKFSPLIAEEDEFSIRLEISNLNKDPGVFTKTIKRLAEKTKDLFKADLSDIGIHNNKDDFEMRIYYQNTVNGKKAYATLGSNMEILPTIDIENSYKEKGRDYADYEKIIEYCFNLLQDLKELPDFNNNE